MIIVLTESGKTAEYMSKYRPIAPVLGVTANPQVARQMLVHRGIFPMLVETMEGTDNILHQAMLCGVQKGMAVKGDPIVVTSGHLEQVSGSTNIMKVKKCVGFEV
jgi:pyruvate kinase